MAKLNDRRNFAPEEHDNDSEIIEEEPIPPHPGWYKIGLIIFYRYMPLPGAANENI